MRDWDPWEVRTEELIKWHLPGDPLTKPKITTLSVIPVLFTDNSKIWDVHFFVPFMLEMYK